MNKNEVLCGIFSLLKTQTKVASNFDRATNLHPHPTDFAHEIHIRWMRILAGSVTSLFNMLAVRHLGLVGHILISGVAMGGQSPGGPEF